MPARLEGGCVVTGFREGEPRRDGALTLWEHFRGDRVSLRVIDLDGAATLRNEDDEEVLYVIEGEGSANGTPIAANTSVYLPPAMELAIEGQLTLVSTRCVGQTFLSGPPKTGQTGMSGPHLEITSLSERPMQRTGDRSYRELIQREVTQFVGAIPPGRAPNHHHLYEEVICILDGEGRMWAGETNTPIETGSCIYLPRKQTHCVENTGRGELRLLGVFYPAGSPAARYS